MNCFNEDFPLFDLNAMDETCSPIDHLSSADMFLNNEVNKGTHWSVPWSDLMMTMFILFCMLYAYPSVKTAAQTARKDELSSLYEEGKETLRAKDFKDIASVELTADKAVKIILPGDIFFDTGDAKIKTAASGSLVAVGELISNKDYLITVAGHTDNIPINSGKYPSNWELSTARACEAARFLIEKADIAPDRIRVAGYGEYRPVASNDLPEGRRANRRVEIIISK